METARVISESDIVPNRAAGYRLADGKLQNQAWVSPTLNTTADGALYLTVLDLAKWDAALTNATVLPQAALERMWTPAELNDGTTAPYGFGWDLGEAAGRRFVAHGGRWQGFASHIVRYLDDGLTVAVLTNLSDANPSRIARGVAGLYEPALAPPTRTQIAIDPVLLERYAGTYEFEPGEGIEIELLDGALWARPGGQAAAQLFPFADSQFFVEIADVEFEFAQSADGSISHLVLHTPGGPREARKVD